MAAITTAANRQRRGQCKTRRFLMAASTTIPKGALVMVNASGLAVNAVDTASFVTVGVAAETVTSAASGSYYIEVEFDADWLFVATSITQAMVGTTMVCVDNNTVDDAAGATNDITVGKLVEFVTTTSGWVNVPGLSV